MFAGLSYYPECGVQDLKLATDDKDFAINEAQKALETNDWCHVFDCEEIVVVFENRKGSTSRIGDFGWNVKVV